MFQMESHGGMYFSMWYGVYDVRSRRLRYASAGHHASYLVSADRATMVPLATRNLVIGAVPTAKFVAAETQVAPASHLYVFSDGVFEVTTADGIQWGLRDFLPLLQAPAAAPGEEAARLYQQVRAVAKPGHLEDDFTALVVTLL
jgi:sigma-B regulation protein RsbU (phosphoserine phosphatase)